MRDIIQKVGKNFYIDKENHHLTFNSEKNTYYDKENKLGGNPIVFFRNQKIHLLSVLLNT